MNNDDDFAQRRAALAAAIRAALGLDAAVLDLTTAEVAKLLRCQPGTLVRYACKPELRHRLPPGRFKRPGQGGWRWPIDQFVDWQLQGSKQAPPLPPRRRPGRPQGSTSRRGQAMV